jgi:hypothetical protein
MSGSTYQIDKVKDLPFAAEFMATPIGHHSPGLQRVLHKFRGEPAAGKCVLVTIAPHQRWQLARLGGTRGAKLEMLAQTYTCLAEAERDVFRRRWQDATGEALTC